MMSTGRQRHSTTRSQQATRIVHSLQGRPTEMRVVCIARCHEQIYCAVCWYMRDECRDVDIERKYTNTT